MENPLHQAVREYLIFLKESGQFKSFRQLAFKLDYSAQYLHAILKKDPPSEELIEKLINTIPGAEEEIKTRAAAILNQSPAPDPKYNEAKLIENNELMSIPLVHERAHAGFSEMWGDREWLDELPTVVMDRRTDGTYVAFEVVGDSMDFDGRNAIQEGDIIIVRELQQHHWRNRLHVPEIFVIVLKHDGILVKEVTGHDVEKGMITCHSFNTYYSDIQVNLNDVVKLYYYKELRRRRRGGS